MRGEGLILELNGFTVELLEARPEAGSAGRRVSVRARVTMLCGCPTEPGGTWDADRFEVFAVARRDGAEIGRAPLAFAGETSVYAGTLPVAGEEPFTLEVVAADPGRANFGIARTEVPAP